MTNVLDLSRNFCYNNNREVKARMSGRTKRAIATKLQLPRHYVELDEQEMMYVDGGKSVTIFTANDSKSRATGVILLLGIAYGLGSLGWIAQNVGKALLACPEPTMITKAIGIASSAVGGCLWWFAGSAIFAAAFALERATTGKNYTISFEFLWGFIPVGFSVS